uniref:Uncharacterized protein n=1 Tax=Cajanus cajan TaxID=3821 RepID=A0A151QL86_CAJCA|nr:hypothetical protein KK1_049200 [Cajanus cajan]
MGDQPAPRERTLREMAAPDFTYESLYIQYPEEDVPFVLKAVLIYLLPKFHGRAGEDPHKHLMEDHPRYFTSCETHHMVHGYGQFE